MKIKELWLERQREIIGAEIKELAEALTKQLPTSFRINTLKIGKEELLQRIRAKGWEFKEVSFYSDGIVLAGKKSAPGNTLEHFMGYIYLQEVASMIPPVVLAPKEGEIILDMAAAPGSKTTQMAQMMKNTGIIVANEKHFERLFSLRANLQRCMITNTIVTQMDGRDFEKSELKFDKILVDAPCSGTGAVMKAPNALRDWGRKTAAYMSNVQKQMLRTAASCVKEGGIIVYSTCSLEPEEDEEVVDYAVKELGLKAEEIKLAGFKTRPGITSWNERELDKDCSKAIRVYPQDNNTEGFFVAKLRK